MLKTELELAVRITVDLARPTSGRDREILDRALSLSREIHRMRGTSDPALALIEQGMMAFAPEPPVTALGPGSAIVPTVDAPCREERRARENAQIRALLAQGLTKAAISRRLGLHVRTVANRIAHDRLAAAVA